MKLLKKRKRRSLQSMRALHIKCGFLLCCVGILLAISVFAPALMPNDPYKTNVLAAKTAPCAEFPCGTDELGRCVLSRVLIGSRPSIYATLILVFLMFAFGSVVGIICGYYGGWIDGFFMRLTDCILSFPQMVLAIAIAGILGGSLVNAMISLGVFGWTSYARLARGKVLALKKEPYVAAARLANNSDACLLFRYILPNAMGPLIVNASVEIGTTLLNLAGMSFLGLGVKVPQAEWGSMINEGRSLLQLAPWIVAAPAVAIFVTVIIFNLLGDTLRDLMDVRQLHSEPN